MESKTYEIKLSIEELKLLLDSRRDRSAGSVFSLNRRVFPDSGWGLVLDMNGSRRHFHGQSEREVIEKALGLYTEPKPSKCRLSWG